MGREKEGYRDQLVRLEDKYPGREVLTLPEVSAALGLHRRTLLKSKGFPAKKVSGKWIIPIVGLARWLA